MEINKAKLENIVKNLPTLPSVVTRCIQMLNDTKSSADSITKILEKDPPLSAKILSIANSSFYSRREKVSDLKYAISFLGFKKIAEIIISTEVFSTFTQSAININFEQFWIHSWAVAESARYIGEKYFQGLQKVDLLYTGGLIHDIGKLVLFHYDSFQMSRVCKKTITSNKPSNILEQQVFGISHNNVIGFLNSKFRLPDEIVEAIEKHHFISESNLGNIIFISNVLAHNLGYGYNCETSSGYDLQDIKEKVTIYPQINWDELISYLENFFNEHVDKFKEILSITI